VKRLISSGALRAVKVAGATRVVREDLETYVSELESCGLTNKRETA